MGDHVEAIYGLTYIIYVTVSLIIEYTIVNYHAYIAIIYKYVYMI